MFFPFLKPNAYSDRIFSSAALFSFIDNHASSSFSKLDFIDIGLLFLMDSGIFGFLGIQMSFAIFVVSGYIPVWKISSSRIEISLLDVFGAD